MMTFAENLERGRFETWSAAPEMGVFHVRQVHGTEIVSLETLPCEADGLLASWDKLTMPLLIKTADCMPILIEGEKGVVFIHAGWRGLANGILKRPELSLILPRRAIIGPCIQSCCFEVSDDFKGNFKDSPFFTFPDGKPHFNLPQEALTQLKGTFPGLKVSVTPICTCCHPDFHSHRRNKTPERNWNLYIKG